MNRRNVVKRIVLGILLVTAGFSNASAQNEHPPFYDEIQSFKSQDSQHFPGKNLILFTGSSSIRMWEHLQDMFPSYPVINRGFGGSTLVDLERYLNDIVFPYEPKQIVIYSGDNDIASSNSITADSVLNRFKKVFDKIRGRLPNTGILYIAIKPSPSRAEFQPVMKEANDKIKKFLSGKSSSVFVDVYSLMLTPDGKPDPSLFREDMLHMNEKGYAIWQKAIQPHLIK